VPRRNWVPRKKKAGLTVAALKLKMDVHAKFDAAFPVLSSEFPVL
jgi:hypothetical protein